MTSMRFSIAILLLSLLLTSCVLGKRTASQTRETPRLHEPVKAAASGLTSFNITPRFFCLSSSNYITVTWSPSGGSTDATLNLTGQVHSFYSLSVPDTGSYLIDVDSLGLDYTYYQVTISNDNGTATSSFVAILCDSITITSVTSPNSSSVIYTNSTDISVVWDLSYFDNSLASILNISFVDQATQINYTFTNIPNNGSVTVDISSLNLPVSNYTVFVLGYANNNPTNAAVGEYSVFFSILSPTPPPVTPVSPGVYVANVNTSLSNGNTSYFIVYSATGLNVSIDNPDAILPSSDLLVTWTPAANLSFFNATLVLVGVSNASLAFSPVNVTDNGSASVSISSFGEPSPGFYELTVDGTLGSGVSLPFPIASASPLNVSLSSNSPAANSTINVTWTPFDILGNATISLLQLSDNTLIPVASNIADNGSLSILLDHAPGAYLVLVNTSIGNGSSSILEITSSLSVSVSPSNISSASESANVTWTPFDVHQVNVSLVVYNGSNVISNTSVPNTGSYPLTLSSAPGLYNVTVVSDIGSGSADLIVYSSTGLSVTSPNASSLLYSNTTNAPFAWSPSDPSTGNVTITLTDLNTNQTFNVTVPNTGSASVNLSALGLPPSSYQATIDSALGSGSSSDFVVKSPLALVVIQPNASTNVSDVGLLDITWTPSNPAGSNATITLYDLSYPPNIYQFSSVDTGNATINLDTQVVSKDLFTAFASQGNPLGVKGTLNRRQIVKV